MKLAMIPEEGHFYKANMHTHTVISDGCHTPEEIKEIYRKQGYSVVAFTDHDVMVSHSDLNDEDFLAITGYEVETNQTPDAPWGDHTYHMNFYAKNPEETYYPCANPAYAGWCNSAKHVQDYYRGDYVRRYSVEGQNEMIADANRHGFLVCYNHPDWSLQTYPEYAGLEGLCGLEVFNTGCWLEGNSLDASDHVLNDFLTLGKRVYPIAADDCHGDADCCGGWICFKAPSLTYDNIMTALEKGDFYASWGPSVESLTMEDGIVKLDCSPVSKVFLRTPWRYTRQITGDGMTHAEFDVRPFIRESVRAGVTDRAFIRLVLLDAEGNRAMTRGYFLDEWPTESL